VHINEIARPYKADALEIKQRHLQHKDNYLDAPGTELFQFIIPQPTCEE